MLTWKSHILSIGLIGILLGACNASNFSGANKFSAEKAKKVTQVKTDDATASSSSEESSTQPNETEISSSEAASQPPKSLDAFSISCQQEKQGTLQKNNMPIAVESLCTEQGESIVIPAQYENTHIVFVLDRAGLEGTYEQLWDSERVVQEQVHTFAQNLRAKGQKVRVGIVDYRFAILKDWEVDLTEETQTFAQKMLGYNKNPLDEILKIDPYADWVTDDNHWLYADHQYSTRRDRAGFLAVERALQLLEKHPDSAKKTLQAVFMITDAVSWSGAKPGSTDTSAISQKLATAHQKVPTRFFFSAPQANGQHFGGITPFAQLQSVLQKSQVPGKAFAFPLTSKTLLTDLVSELLPQPQTQIKQEQCLAISLKIVNKEGTVLEHWQPDLSEAIAIAKKEKSLPQWKIPEDAAKVHIERCCVADYTSLTECANVKINTLEVKLP